LLYEGIQVTPWWSSWLGSSIALDVMSASAASSRSLQERQSRRFAALLVASAANSPLYRRIIGRGDPARVDLHQLPVMTKRELMQQFDDWVTDPRLTLHTLSRFIADPASVGRPFLGHYIVWESSGSSGEPGIFVQDESALAVNDALEALRRQVLQPLRRFQDPWYATERLAFVGATGGHFASTASVRRLCRLNPWMDARLKSFSFLEPVQSLVAQLNAHAPTVLSTYPTAAMMLAEQAVAGRLRIPLKEIWTGGETLTPAMRKLIASGFDCPVAQSYGASEFLSLAGECRCRRLHLNSDWVILESVDERHSPVPAGQAGSTTLLTNLANRVQPIIRYDLGDRVCVRAAPCACGSALPVIEVQGRIDDSIVLADASGTSVRLLPLALTTVLEEEAGLFDFQLQQQGDGSLQLSVSAGGADGAGMATRGRTVLRKYLKAQGLQGVTVNVRCGLPPTPGRSGKVQRVVAWRGAGSGRTAPAG